MPVERKNKDPEDLVKKLHAAAKAEPNSEEILNQRVSFVMGSLKAESGVTRERVREIILRQEGRQR